MLPIHPLTPIILTVAVIALIIVMVSRTIQHVDLESVNPERGHFPYIKKTFLMTKAEFNFYKVLEKAVNEKYYIVPQVALSKLVQVKSREIKWRTYNNKIDRKSVDFTLFSKPYFIPVMVIELDDQTHNQADRIVRDTEVDGILYEAGIKIAHIKNSYSYNIEQISSSIPGQTLQ